MGNDDLKRLQRAEVAARLAALDSLIKEQAEHIAQSRKEGWDTTLSEERLRLMIAARRLHVTTFATAYGKDVIEEDDA